MRWRTGMQIEFYEWSIIHMRPTCSVYRTSLTRNWDLIVNEDRIFVSEKKKHQIVLFYVRHMNGHEWTASNTDRFSEALFRFCFFLIHSKLEFPLGCRAGKKIRRTNTWFVWKKNKNRVFIHDFLRYLCVCETKKKNLKRFFLFSRWIRFITF